MTRTDSESPLDWVPIASKMMNRNEANNESTGATMRHFDHDHG